MDKKKCRVDTEVFCEILQICPRLPDQEFIVPPSKDDLVSFIKELSYSGRYEMLSATYTDQMHQPWRTFAAIINRKNLHTVRDDSLLDIKDSKAYKTYYDYAFGKVAPKKARKYKKIASPSRKVSPVLEAKHVKKPKRKKAPAKVTKDKGIDLLSDVTLLEAAQLKKAIKESKQETHKVYDSGSSDGVGSQSKVPNEHEDKTSGIDEGTGTKPRVPDVPTYESKSENESWGDSQDDERNDVDRDDDNDSDNKNDDSKNDYDGDFDADNNERTDSDSDKEVNPNLNLKHDEEEEIHDDEYVHTPDYYIPDDEESHEDNKEFDDEEFENLYGDVNINLKDAEHVLIDTHVTITQKTDSSKQSSSISSGFATQFLNLDNIPLVDTEVACLMNTNDQNEEPTQEEQDRYFDVIEKSIKVIIKVEVQSQLPQILSKEVSDFATPMIQSKIAKSLENVGFTKSSSQPTSTYEAATSLTEFELKKIILDKIEKSKSYRATSKHRQLYNVLIKSYNMDKDLFDSYM
ncbi:hypothetical protein Tco_0613312 [Tanacetum coccineum]